MAQVSGVLVAVGGDLIDNTRSPSLNSIMPDPEAGNASVDKLSGYGIRTVYPGRGDPFPMAQFQQAHR